MRINNLVFMMLFCLLGIVQIRYPSPVIIFINILTILMLIYFINGFEEGWEETLNEWEKSINNFDKSISKFRDIKLKQKEDKK